MQELLHNLEGDLRGLEDDLIRCAENYIYDIIRSLKIEAAKNLLPMPVSEYAAPAADDFEWIYRARSHDENRFSLWFIHVKNGVAECTNGHVLLWVKTDKADGFYKNGDDTVFEKITYPDTSKVIPKYDNFQPIVVENEDSRLVRLNNKTAVNAQYFLLITESKPDDWEVAFNESSNIKPLLFRHKKSSRMAVLMPLKV